ncbi:DUF3021 domain-containing protein [Lachnospiraceae bacterium OttesenSCG-928-E19]|nr:DUF3021 domain-containing protein [Lachnospiraceae bacterium OttesenSCG-928-E19]
MTFREIMKFIVDLSSKILASLVVLSYAYTSLFEPEITFGTTTFGKMIFVTLICSLLTFVLYSKKELSSAKMRNRYILHCISLAVTAPGLLLYWNWIPRTVWHALAAVLLTLLTYAVIMLYMYLRHKSVTDQLNRIIQKNKKQ